MSGRKWFAMFLTAFFMVFVVWAGINIVVDPFNSFGDMILKWDSYTQTLNPRNSKVTYISENFDSYDSYVIGSSSAASYLPENLNEYYDASFYNMFHYGADTEYDKQLVSYLLENDDVKHIFLVLGLNEANSAYSESDNLTEKSHYKVSGENVISYYTDILFASPDYAMEKLVSRKKDTVMPQAFDVFIPKSGVYDKRLRDVESIGTIEAYLERNNADFLNVADEDGLLYIDECAENIMEIRKMCEKEGTELTVVLSPVSEQQLQCYGDEELDTYYSKLAEITDYWNFSISSVTYDERYFYDATHTRNSTAAMVLARIYNDENVYYPEDFGVYCKKGEGVTAEELKMKAASDLANPYTQTVPILLYHHLSETEEESGTILSPDTFERHMKLLYDNGYHTITFEELAAYVEQGAKLPENPIIITFDDGYQSNYEYAFPVLREYNFCATIFAIGSSIGHDKYYKDTNYELTPHFGVEEIQKMEESGIISIQSHTFDMHQWAPFESGDKIRETILPLETESEEEYISVLTQDVEQQDEIFAECGLEKSNVLAFPRGAYTTLTDVVLQSCGYKITVTTDYERVNTVVCGLPQSLIDLGRKNIEAATTEEEILEYCRINGN